MVRSDGLPSRNLSIINTLKMMVMGVHGLVIAMCGFNLKAAELVEDWLNGDRLVHIFDDSTPTMLSGANR